MSGRPGKFRDMLPRAARVVRRFAPQLRRQRALIAGSMSALLVTTALKLLEPWPLKVLFDNVLYQSDRRAARWSFLPFLDGMPATRLVVVCAVAILVITALRATGEYLVTVGFATIGNRVLKEVRDQVYRHLQRLSLSFHNTSRNGDLTVRVIGDVNMLRDVLVTAILPLIASVLIVVGMWSVMFVMQWKLALLAAATTPLMWFHARRSGRKIRENAKKQRQRESEMASTAAESLAGIKLVQALSLEDAFAQDFSSRNASSQKQEVKNARLAAALERSVDVLLALATGLVIFYGARLVLTKQLTAGELIVFLAYLKRAFNPVQDFAKYTARLAKATAAGERVLDLLDRQPDVHDQPHAVPLPAVAGRVTLENVGFEYEPSRPVLDRVSLDIEPGRHVAIVGPSGGGKSTLASLLLRLYDPTSGRILIDGHDLRDVTIESLRRQVSVVLQETLLFAGSVRDNIACAAPGATEADVVAAARLANAHAFIQSMPNGYDTRVGERGATLSGGQRQRIAVARAAIRRSPVLIFDEPTTGLDEDNVSVVTQALERLADGRTAVYITHDLQLASRADLIVYLDGGQVVERGTHDELLRDNGRYAKLYGLQVGGVIEQAGPVAAEEVAHVAAR